mmetsp:Transcript_42916/g.113638  ORF Transcript_42916/g.113638 Transcript_42916/m.113638 type:complete len:774 (+) Transcript_42916:1859-4180(+)
MERDDRVLREVRLPHAQPPAPADPLQGRPGPRQLLRGRPQHPLQRRPDRREDLPLQAVPRRVHPARLQALPLGKLVPAHLRAALHPPPQDRPGVRLQRHPLRGRHDGDEGVREGLLGARGLRVRGLGEVAARGLLRGERPADPDPQRQARGGERREALRRSRQGDLVLLGRRAAGGRLRALRVVEVDALLRGVRGRPEDAGPGDRPGPGRREAVRRLPGGDRQLPREPVQGGAEGLHPGGLGQLDLLRRRGDDVPLARRRAGALRDGRGLQGLPPGGGGLQQDGRLRRQRVDELGHVRQDLRRGPDAARAGGHREPQQRRQSLPGRPHPHHGLQHPALLGAGLHRQRVVGVVSVQRHLRRRHRGPRPRLHGAPLRGRPRLRPGPDGGPAVPAAGVPVRRLPLERVVRVEHLQRPLRRRAALARSRHHQGAPPGVQALRGQGQGGDRAVQHPALPREGLHQRPVGPMERLGAVLDHVQGRRDLARPRGRGRGQRLRSAGGRAVHGAQDLQRQRRVHAQHRLPVHGVAGLDRLLLPVRGHHAPRSQGPDPRPGGGPVLRRGRGADLAVRDRVRRAGLHGAEHVPRPLPADHQQPGQHGAGDGEHDRAGDAARAQLQPGRLAAGDRHLRGPGRQAHERLHALRGADERRAGAHLRRHQRAVRLPGLCGVPARRLEDRRPGQRQGARDQGVRPGWRRRGLLPGEAPRQGLHRLLRHQRLQHQGLQGALRPHAVLGERVRHRRRQPAGPDRDHVDPGAEGRLIPLQGELLGGDVPGGH